MNIVFDLSTLGSANIAVQLNHAFHEAKVSYNKKVEENRYILSKIIGYIQFCGAFEHASRCHNESSVRKSWSVLGLIDFVATLDSAVKKHLDSNQAFKGVSKTIQNDSLDCMLEVTNEVLINEVAQSDFLAIMADETTDVAEKQLVVMF